MNIFSRFAILFLTTSVLLSFPFGQQVTLSQVVQISNGIGYLKSTQNADGSWGTTSSSLNHTFPTTTAALEALRTIETSASANQTNAIQFLNAQIVEVNPFLAARVKAVSGASSTTNDLTALLAGQNADGGWGTADVFQSDPLDTSLVLLALKAGGVTDERVLITALTYVVRAQNTDGGWSLTQGEDSQIFYTAYALQALNAFRSQYPSLVFLSDARALAYLHARQNVDGGYGNPLSTPFETALTLQAINGLGVQTPAEANAVNYLNSTQQANGSWIDDAYSTALVLRALTAQLAGPPNQPPLITSQPITTAREAQAYSYQLEASDPENDPLSFALLRSPSGMTISSAGLVQWTPPAAQAGSAVVIIKVSDNKGGFTLQQFTINVLALGVDLTPSSVDISAVTTDTATLVIGGTVHVLIQNKGGSLFAGSFAVLLFADSNGNGTYQPGVDSLLGTNRYSGSIDSNADSSIDMLVSGVVQFRDNLIYAFVDSSNEVPELNETNNIAGSGRDSKYQPPVGDFQPKVKWEYASPRAGVYSPPVVAPLIDTNGDGLVNERDIPAVIAVDYDFSGGPARLVALHGDTGATIFSTAAPFSGYGTAVGNIDGVGPPEVCAPDFNHVRCFKNDGTLSWTSPNLTRADSITLADLDGDGKSEILCGSGALNFDGTLRWDNFNRLPGYFGGVSATRARQVADLDLDGPPEIISGASALDRNGDAIWYWSSFSNGDGTWTSRGTLDRGATTVSFVSNFSLNDGFTAVANLDNDPNPEIVFINDSAIDDSMWIFEHDGRIKTGRPIALYQQIPGVSFTMGAPTVADFDGDGQPEIAVPAKQQLFSFPTPDNPQRAMMAVYRLDGTLLWRQNLISSGQPSNGIYPSSAFDFDGDGAAELVYQDTQRLYILNGHDGTSLFEFAVNRVQDGEATRYPTIADVDNDGSADIVVPASQSFIASAASRAGLLVLSDIKGNWRNSRRVWNQWLYHVTNVNEDGLIPRVAANNWQSLNSQRTQTSIEGLDRSAAPDLTVSRVTINTQSCPASLSITARIGNGGALHAGAGVKVNFYSGDPASGGVLIGTMQTTRALYPGEFEDVTLIGVAPTNQQVFVTVNDPPATTLTPSANLSRLPYAWAQSSGYFVTSFVPVNQQAYSGIDGNTSGGWSENFANGAVSTGPSYYEVRFPFPVNANSVTVQNAGAGNTAFLAGTLSFSNGFTTPATLNANGEGTTSFAEQQNVSWVRLTASSIKTGGASVSEFIVGGSYTEPQFRLNEGEGRGNNNKASAAAVTTPCDLNTNQPPQITSAPPTSAQIGVGYSYQVLAVDANSDPLSYALITAPAGMTIGATGLISWTPASSQDGDSAVTVTVSDGRGGIAQQSCTIRVPAPATPNRPPQISSTSPVAVIMGQTLQYDVIALDPDGDTIVFTLLQSPAGATIDQFAGRVLWSPNGTQAAPQYFFVEAQDGKGGRATQSFFVAVSAPADELPPGTLPPGTIGCSIATDKRSYSSNSVAQILASLQNHSATLSAANLQAQITVSNPNGQNIFTSPLSVNTLFPRAFFKGGSTFANATRSPGIYRTTLDVRYGQQQVCTSQASFDILSSAAQSTALAGTINVTPAIIEKPAGAAFSYQVNNVGNVDLSALAVTVLLVDVATGDVVQTFMDQTALNQGQSFSNNRMLNSTAVPPGDYLVILQGQSSGTTQTIGSAALHINSSTLHLNATGYTVAEGCGVATITVTRTGDSSNAITVDYATVDAGAQQRTDYTLSSGTLSLGAGETSQTFTVLVNEDGYAEGNETLTISLSNATNGAGVGLDGTATLTITDNDALPATTNPIDEVGTFVCEHYHDFLAREADTGGAAYWTSQIAQCGTDPVCLRNKRIDVSNAFFFEQEFQETGAYVYRIYKAALGQRPSYAQFMPDRSRVPGGPQLDQSKTDFANAFVQRPAFIAIYSNSITPAQYVDGLNANTESSLTQAQRDALVAGLTNGMETRGSVLRKVADNSAFIDREYNASFVLSQYFGYLRRDLDQGGFDFWLGQVNRFPIRNVAIQHAMVCSFITSSEYQERFGAIVSHSNQECPQ